MKLQKCLSYLKDSLVGVRTSSISIGLLETLKVEYYGSMTPLKEIASISLIERRMEVRVYDQNILATIHSLLNSSGFSSYRAGKGIIVISIPQPSGDERKKIEKVLKALMEETKVAIRNVRREERKASSKEEYEKIDKLTQEYIEEVDRLIESKIK